MPSLPTLAFDRTHIKPGDRICIAISGGADSVALLLTLHAANAARHNALGIGLSAVHVNHGLRAAESDADQRFVENLCIGLDIPLHLHHADVAARATEARETIEEAARALRYDFFSTLLSSGHADAVLTAHTLDDQAETVLMKLLRGAWTEGLSAIHPIVAVNHLGHRPGRILRPFLQTRRADIEAFLKQSNQPWQEDATNADTAYTRNRIRHELLPQLRDYNPSLDQTLANLAELAREEEIRWQTELSRLLPQLILPGKPVRGGGRSVSTTPGESALAIEIDRLRPLDPALRRRVLRAAARQLGFRLSFEETARLLALCGFQPHPTVSPRNGAVLQLANNLRAKRSPREIRLSRHQN
jgi:tRNA(Ile)-lysidine synthase